MIRIPDDYAAALIRREGEDGRRWLHSLPDRITALCRQWRLEVDGPPMYGGLSLVIPVRRGDERCMLKIVGVESDATAEALALTAWDGRGAVRLLAVDAPQAALLLERLDSQRSTRDLPLEEAFSVAARLLRRLAVPAPAGLPRLGDVAPRLAAELPARWEELARPLPLELLDEACAVATLLGPAASERLVHYDLHDDNILAGTREPWLAIDPKVIAGDPEYGVAQLLWCRLDELDGPAELQRRLAAICAVAELDLQRTIAWSLVRCVDYWLWGLSVGLTEDPVRCATLTSWLRLFRE